MQAVTETAVILALLNLGGAEILLIPALVVILFGARNLPELGRGLRRGIFEFRRATKHLTDVMDDEASESGRSVGGIYGKAAGEALTPDNQVAELYDPNVLRREPQRTNRHKGMPKIPMKLWHWLRQLIHAIWRLRSQEVRPRRSKGSRWFNRCQNQPSRLEGQHQRQPPNPNRTLPGVRVGFAPRSDSSRGSVTHWPRAHLRAS